jgi:hypothetical protein
MYLIDDNQQYLKRAKTNNNGTPINNDDTASQNYYAIQSP